MAGYSFPALSSLNHWEVERLVFLKDTISSPYIKIKYKIYITNYSTKQEERVFYFVKVTDHKSLVDK